MISQPDTDSSTHTPLLWQRNGQTMNGWWRIDGSSERVGVDFMEHPAAIVPDETDADLIVRAVNNFDKLLKALMSRGCENSTAEYPPCIDEQPARQSWCKTCDAIEEAQS